MTEWPFPIIAVVMVGAFAYRIWLSFRRTGQKSNTYVNDLDLPMREPTYMIGPDWRGMAHLSAEESGGGKDVIEVVDENTQQTILIYHVDCKVDIKPNDNRQCAFGTGDAPIWACRINKAGKIDVSHFPTIFGATSLGEADAIKNRMHEEHRRKELEEENMRLKQELTDAAVTLRLKHDMSNSAQFSPEQQVKAPRSSGSSKSTTTLKKIGSGSG